MSILDRDCKMAEKKGEHIFQCQFLDMDWQDELAG